MDLRMAEMFRFCVVLGLVLVSVWGVDGSNGVFRVQHKYKGTEKFSLGTLRDHDMRRHGRLLFDVEIPLGGNGNPSASGLYFTKIQIGNPSKDYYVQVDTGSDILWVNCVGCNKCPTKSVLGIKLSLYDPKESSTAHLVTCEDSSCAMIYAGTLSGCQADLLCNYQVTYGDGSTTSGYFVQDDIHYDRVSGNLQTTTANGSVVFGCGAKQGGQLSSSDEALDGIVGFGQANSSMLSQLAAAGKVKKMFAHCLDGVNGGGIFAIGEVVQPKLKTTPLVPHQAHYNVIMKSIEVAGDVIEPSTDSTTSGSNSAAILDSGTTLAYLPDGVYDELMSKIIAHQPDLSIHTVEDAFKCFQYTKDIDDGFPDVKLHFDNSLTMTVYPHEYLFEVRSEVWCFGWQNSGLQSKDGKDVTLLGDLVLSNKLIVFDLVNQTVGWTEYNCSSSIKLKDESGNVYTVNAQDIAAGSCLHSWKRMSSSIQYSDELSVPD
ncbi:Aspartic proteinase 36-like protein, partial [Drosera capensis]